MRLSTPLIPTARRTLAALLIAGVVAIEAEAQQPDQGEPAQEACAVLEAVIQSAASGFERYRATEVAPNRFEASIWISGFDSCSVILTADGGMYVCTRFARSEATVRRLYDLTVDTTRTCLPNWGETPPNDAPAQGLEMIQGLRRVEKLDAGEIAIGIGHARDTRQGPAQDSVSLVVTFRRQSALAT
jgi:hypothetical protein